MGIDDFIFGAGLAGVNNIFGMFGADRAREENYRIGEKQAENADRRTRALYNDLYSMPAQMRQLKEAGLSPSLYYGDGGGISGQTGAMGNAAGVNQSVFGVDPLTLSQIKVNEAQANKLNNEADTEAGINDRGMAQIAKLWADLGAVKASTELTKAQVTWQNFTNSINDATKEAQVWKIKSDARRAADEAQSAYWEAENAGLQFQFNLANYDTELKKSFAQLENLIASAELTKAETSHIINEIETMWINALANEENAEANTKNAEAYANYVESFCDNLPKQLELRKEELKTERWKIGVGAFTETVRTVGYFLGAQQLGDGGTTSEQWTTDYNNKGKVTHQKHTSTKNVKLPRVK